MYIHVVCTTCIHHAVLQLSKDRQHRSHVSSKTMMIIESGVPAPSSLVKGLAPQTSDHHTES